MRAFFKLVFHAKHKGKKATNTSNMFRETFFFVNVKKKKDSWHVGEGLLGNYPKDRILLKSIEIMSV